MNSNLSPEDKKRIGAYLVHNRNTDETYFGSGILGDRHKLHAKLLERGEHWNYRLQNAYNRDPNFDFVAIPVDAETPEEARQIALAIEQMDIDENWGNPLLLNIARDVEAPMFGYKHREESNEKNRQAALTRWQDPEFRKRNIEAAKTGRESMTEEDRRLAGENMSRGQLARYERLGESPTKGQIRSDEFRERNSQYVTEKWQDPEYREKQRLKKLGNTNAPTKAVIGDGVEYPSLTEAANALGIAKQSIKYRIESPNYPGWQYKD